MKYTTITNLRSVCVVGAANLNICVGMIQIADMMLMGTQRCELRGIQAGGLTTFCVLLDTEAPIEIEPVEGGNLLLLSDSSDKPLPLDGGAKLRVTTQQGQELVLELLAEDYQNPKIEVRDIEAEKWSFGEDVDRELLKYWTGSGYPRIEWVDALGYRALLEGEREGERAKEAIKNAEQWIEGSRAYRARLEANSRELRDRLENEEGPQNPNYRGKYDD
ncbi:hypothetical protein LCGC14_2629720 [marine sediment metagenome]|uniref:Uncharacterized protein n=1 Tax=marine sediment metagenome TaxID=412755 RepID=A0A0F9AN85_9ZZZZ